MQHARRKLTTILYADVENYSRLMGADEEGTHAALMRRRHAIGHIIHAHDGRLINSWGDALIAEFQSVVEAVRAAIDIQSDMERQNAERPEAVQMRFRIGINLGDVIVEGDDIYGDGVNIAARLQAEAPAGGIVVSRTVHDQVHTKLAGPFRSLGTLAVKNIAQGVPAYAVSRPGVARDRQASLAAQKPAGRIFGRWSGIAVLIVVVNLLTWTGTFWAAWPLLALVAIATIRRSRDLGRS